MAGWLVAAFRLPQLPDQAGERPKWEDNSNDWSFQQWTGRLRETVWLFDLAGRRLTEAASALLQELALGSSDMQAQRPEVHVELALFLDSALSYLRIQADCVAHLVPQLYGMEGRKASITTRSFHDQQKWFREKRPEFDPTYKAILEEERDWFESIRGLDPLPSKQPGMRDMRTHTDARYQLVVHTDDHGISSLRPGLVDATGYRYENVLQELRTAVAGYCRFLDHSLQHFESMIAEHLDADSRNMFEQAIERPLMQIDGVPLEACAGLWPAIVEPRPGIHA
ncbi:MAG: hypothetical protein WD271_15635 [Acidimicrobiia bacterium]